MASFSILHINWARFKMTRLVVSHASQEADLIGVYFSASKAIAFACCYYNSTHCCGVKIVFILGSHDTIGRCDCTTVYSMKTISNSYSVIFVQSDVKMQIQCLFGCGRELWTSC